LPPLTDDQKDEIYTRNVNPYRSMLANGSYSNQVK